MEILINSTPLEKTQADAAVLTIFDDHSFPTEAQETVNHIEEALGGLLGSLISSGEIKGKANETTLIHTQGKLAPARLLVVGLGKREQFSLTSVRKAAGTAASYLCRKGCRKISTLLIGTGLGISPAESARAMVEGALLGLYIPKAHKSSEDKKGELAEINLLASDEKIAASLALAVRAGKITSEAANFARDLGNEPANLLTPSTFVQRALELIGELKLQAEVLEEEQMRQLGMGALLAVASGSAQPPRMLVLRYKPTEEARLLGLVGKGITFDSGGLSLKNRDGMEKMKNDMAGAAAVLGAMLAIARLELPINVIGVMPLTENLPGGKAYRPGDVITTMAGKTIEVISTDAEGRMILADALAYIVKQGATHIIDIATLTGSCAVALGAQASGLFSPDDDFADTLAEVGEAAGERLWRLPLYPEYKESMESKVADMKNFGARYGDASNAAIFLKEFTDGKPWVHLDIAATDWNEKGRPYLAEGPTGVGAATLIRLAERLARPKT